MEQIERITATKIVIRVNGFYDAKEWMYRILNAGIATCSHCDQIANRIYWQDQAEWYYECPAHHTHDFMWGGHTRWNPSAFSKRVIPELAQAWVATLEPGEQKRIRLKEYDATDYYSWLTDDDWMNPDEVVLKGTKEWGTKVHLRPLRNGQYAYEISTYSPGFSCGHAMKAPFDSRDAALEAARAEVEAK